MAFERADAAGSWQLPQGGLTHGEEPIEGAWRELMEETCAGRATTWSPGPSTRSGSPTSGRLEVMRVARPRTARRRGQVQRWFLFDALSRRRRADARRQRVRAWQWVEPEWLIDHVLDWRRDAYRRVLTHACG